MKTKTAKILAIGIGIMLVGVLLLSHGLVYAAVEGVHVEETPKPTQPVMTQPLPPSVEPGANLPLVCGGLVLLVIITGGVMLVGQRRKSGGEDH